MSGLDLDDYFKTNFEHKLLIKMPERDDDHLLPATRLLDKRREVIEVDNALTAQRDDFKMKLETLSQRKEELERRECDMKKAIRTCDKYLKEDHMKRDRATKKIVNERDLIFDKESNMISLDKEQLSHKNKTIKQNNSIQKQVKFKLFMDDILKFSGEFNEIGEIMSRLQTLKSTHRDLLIRDTNYQDAIEEERNLSKKFIEDKNNEILHYTNQLSSLQAKLEQQHNLTLLRESEWNTIQTTAAEKTLLLGQIKMSTHNLYTHISARQRSSTEVDEKTLDQLHRIQQFILDVSVIVNDIVRAEQHEIQEKMKQKSQLTTTPGDAIGFHHI